MSFVFRPAESSPLLGQHTAKKPDGSLSVVIHSKFFFVGLIVCIVLSISRVLSPVPDRHIVSSPFVNLTANQICRDQGQREYTAQLVDIPLDWHWKEACELMLLDMDAGAVAARESVNYCENLRPNGEEPLVVGHWIVDDESCRPHWPLYLTPGNCVALGIRQFSAHMIPPLGIDPYRVCQSPPTGLLPQGEERLPDACTVQEDGSIIGLWVSETQGCEPTWSDVAARECEALETRHYTASIARVPTGLDPLLVCTHVPFEVHGHSHLASFCEPQDDDSLLGHWSIRSEEDCMPHWSSMVDNHYAAFDKCELEAVLQDVPVGLSALDLCTSFPNEAHGHPDRCELRGEDTVGVWYERDAWCQPFLFDVQDQDCQQSNIRRIQAKVRDTGEADDDWYKLCAMSIVNAPRRLCSGMAGSICPSIVRSHFRTYGSTTYSTTLRIKIASPPFDATENPVQSSNEDETVLQDDGEAGWVE
ncbi:hypothetical protein FISHEDRAFT_61379 [Fistulina hepatica ATCC 64428]|uniref:Uncharacterized protein n=1 Tax=Fistulina hepatica ATCC 64428 TaxID=1128425 RepID=A0A0D7A499_9AGAR|nr:hypothetical protein FISHEDRAFT_61379 [Fistulina hepatica ATCC 64428]